MPLARNKRKVRATDYHRRADRLACWALVVQCVCYSGCGKPSQGADWLAMLGPAEAVMKTRDGVYHLGLTQKSAVLMGKAQLAAISREQDRIVLASLCPDGTRIRIVGCREPFAPLGQWRVPLIMRDVVPAPYGPYDFLATWTVPGSEDVCLPWLATFVQMDDSGDVGLDSVPVLSGLLDLVRPGALRCSTMPPYPIAASGIVSAASQRVYGRPLGQTKDLLFSSALVLIAEDRLVNAWPIPGPSGGTPLAFDKDGKRLLARLPGQESPFMVVDVRTGQAVRWPGGQSGDRLLAVDDSLRRAVLRQGDMLYWWQEEISRKPLLHLPGSTRIAAAFHSGNAVITDGSRFWVVGDGSQILTEAALKLRAKGE